MPDDILDDLVRIARRCERAAKAFDREPLASMVRQLLESADSVGKAACGSWFGYLATVYLDGLRPARPGEYFDTEWGLTDPHLSETTGGPWREYSPKDVVSEIQRRAKTADLEPLQEAARVNEEIFENAKAELVPTLAAVLARQDDSVLKDILGRIDELSSSIAASHFANSFAPQHNATRDSRAHQGSIQAPPHISFKCRILHFRSSGTCVGSLGKLASQVATYLEKKAKLKGKTVAKTSGRIFIGHGRAVAWRDLKDFLQDRLGLQWDEFNREPVAGLTTTQRLEDMLDSACFAFLVMTAEDERTDGTRHARENVVHEAGLFQGRLGFERAIILLEDGCSEFSNILGLTQIRFPAGHIKAAFEEIRRVLEREKII